MLPRLSAEPTLVSPLIAGQVARRDPCGEVVALPDLWTYYERRADEYEAGTLEGLDEDAEKIRAEGRDIARVLSELPAVIFVDVGAGTSLFTRHLRWHCTRSKHGHVAPLE